MKRLFNVLTISMIMLLSSCNTKKYESLELKNLQLQKEVDSCRLVAQTQRMLADSCRFVATMTQQLLIECQEQAKIKK
jgi:hypothetical protein